jgi:hypothetical protein
MSKAQELQVQVQSGGKGRIIQSMRKMCSECGDKRAVFRVKGPGKTVKADKEHTLCFKCSLAHINRNRWKPQADAEPEKNV